MTAPEISLNTLTVEDVTIPCDKGPRRRIPPVSRRLRKCPSSGRTAFLERLPGRPRIALAFEIPDAEASLHVSEQEVS